MFLTAVERAQRLFPRADSRPKITHCTLINDDLVRRIKAVGAIPAMFTTYAYYNSDKFVFYGEDLMKRCMAYRTFLDAGDTGPVERSELTEEDADRPAVRLEPDAAGVLAVNVHGQIS